MSIVSLMGSPVLDSVGTQLRNAQGESQSSVQRLSSGSAIVRASDDVSSMAIATDLQRNVTGLKASLNNALQAQSYLSVADGALSKIEEVLQRMSSISIQANSGALLDKERGFLNLEFQNLKDEIDRLAENTSFGNASILQRVGDGPLGLSYDTSEPTQATGSIRFLNTGVANNTIALNGVSIEVPAGAPVEELAERLVTILNDTELLEEELLSRIGAPTALDRQTVAENVGRIQEATYEADGDTIRITHRSTGELGNNFSITVASANFQIGGEPEDTANRYILAGGSDGGSNAGNVYSSGFTSPSGILTEQTAKPTEALFTLDPNTNITDGSAFGVNSSGGYIVFTFRDNPSASPLEIQIGENAEETMRILTATLNDYSAVDDYAFEQLDFIRDGTDLLIRSKQNGNPLQLGTSTATPVIAIGELSAGVFLESDVILGNTAELKDLNDGSIGGLNTDGISNEAFIGSLDAVFDVEVTGANKVNASITVGEHNYTATILNTNTDIDRVVQFNSVDGGGFFTMELAAGNGFDVLNSDDASAYADKLNTVLEARSFYQERDLESINGTGFLGVDMSLRTNSTDAIRFDDITVRSDLETGGNGASISLMINGEEYRASNAIGTAIGANEIFEFQNVHDANKLFTFSTRDNGAFDLQNKEDAEALELFMRDALGFQGNNANMPETEEFRVSLDTLKSNDISLRINYISTESLFEDAASVNVQTVEDAENAAAAIAEAIVIVTQERSNVGSAQARLEYAINQTNTAIINQDSARAALSDTDVVSESTRFALEQVKLNAGISLLAQTNALKSTLVSRLYN